MKRLLFFGYGSCIPDLPRHVPLRRRLHRRLRRADALDGPLAGPARRRSRSTRAADRFRGPAQRDGAPVVQGALDADRAVADRAIDLRAVRQPRADPAVLAVAADRRRDLVHRKPVGARRAVDAVRLRLGTRAGRRRSSSTTSICSASGRCGCRSSAGRTRACRSGRRCRIASSGIRCMSAGSWRSG